MAEKHKRPSVLFRTYEWYLNIQKSADVSAIERPLSKVSWYEVQNMLSVMQQKGLSARRVKTAHNLLSPVFKALVEFAEKNHWRQLHV